MLVVSRKSKQSLMIGEDIEIVILECKDGSVKIGISAPKDVKVYRKEIFDDIKNENNKALQTDICAIKNIIDIKKGPTIEE